jgi:hypothetical protein
VFHLRFQGLAARAVLTAVTLAGVSRSGETQMVTPRTLSAYDAGVVRRAVEEARTRLRVAQCEGLVDEFKDAGGLPLRKRLEAQGMTIDARLDAIRFVDASESAHCRASGTFAFAVRDGLVVYVCPRTMEKAQSRQPARVQAVVIHELLHTIGLGENPPTSTYITARVEARCLSN